MKNKKLGVIYIIVGSYFSIINVILSIIFLQFSSTVFYYQLNSLEFWNFWFVSGGWSVTIIAVLGVYLIIIGIRNYKKQLPSNS